MSSIFADDLLVVITNTFYLQDLFSNFDHLISKNKIQVAQISCNEWLSKIIIELLVEKLDRFVKPR